jgi:hypothetical protein
MNAPIRLTTSTLSQIDVYWDTLNSTGTPNNGLSAITSYFLEWDAGTNGVTWSEIVGNSPSSLVNVYSVTGGSTGLTVGALYGFRVSARNKHGWG